MNNAKVAGATSSMGFIVDYVAAKYLFTGQCTS